MGPRTVVLQRSAAGFGFVLRGLKGKADIQPTGFAPTSDFPSLQCLQHVDAGGVAEKAGLKAGDFILEVCIGCLFLIDILLLNGINVLFEMRIELDFARFLLYVNCV